MCHNVCRLMSNDIYMITRWRGGEGLFLFLSSCNTKTHKNQEE